MNSCHNYTILATKISISTHNIIIEIPEDLFTE